MRNPELTDGVLLAELLRAVLYSSWGDLTLQQYSSTALYCTCAGRLEACPLGVLLGFFFLVFFFALFPFISIAELGGLTEN